jgi:hypothetical protein
MGDPSSFKEIASFAGVIVPIMVAFLWGGRMLLAWFTKTLDTKDQLIAAQQGQVDRLITDLMTLMRETQSAHLSMAQTLADARVESAREHQKIVECMMKFMSPSTG